ncbi:MAG: winged helix-turn-helix transcriptional regulator [Syntrophaceae bacterium]|nr:winged helix-turn-helix transcriptional regulator [Syntrophaceae bacterium]
MDFLVKIFKALANEHRVQLLRLLLGGQEKEISELARTLRLPYKTVARNLKILEQTNLVSSRRWKGMVYYSLRNDPDLEYNRLLYGMISKRFNRPR